MQIRTYNYRGKKLFEVVDSETNVLVPIVKGRHADIKSQEDSGHESPITSTNHQRVA